MRRARAPLLSVLLPALARRAAAEQPPPVGPDCEPGAVEFEAVRVDGEEVVFLRRGPGCPIAEPEFPAEETTTVPSTTAAPEGHDTSTATEEVFAVGYEGD